jgi:hypothetical protein
VNQVRKARGVLIILFEVLLLRPDDGTHVTKGVGFGFRSRRISLKLWLICGLCQGKQRSRDQYYRYAAPLSLGP